MTSVGNAGMGPPLMDRLVPKGLAVLRGVGVRMSTKAGSEGGFR